MLNVEMQEDGIVVHNIEPRVRPEDPAWLRLNPIARDKLMTLANFTAQVVPAEQDGRSLEFGGRDRDTAS
jgi:hypothetical protein